MEISEERTDVVVVLKLSLSEANLLAHLVGCSEIQNNCVYRDEVIKLRERIDHLTEPYLLDGGSS